MLYFHELLAHVFIELKPLLMHENDVFESSSSVSGAPCTHFDLDMGIV